MKKQTSKQAPTNGAKSPTAAQVKAAAAAKALKAAVFQAFTKQQPSLAMRDIASRVGMLDDGGGVKASAATRIRTALQALIAEEKIITTGTARSTMYHKGKRAAKAYAAAA